MGGHTKSSNTTNNTNVSGGNTAMSGDNLGVVLSGINGDVGDITMTDHGAVKGALESNQKAIAEAAKVGMEAVKSNSDVSKASIQAGTESLKEALNFGAKSIDSVDKNSAGNRALLKTLSEQSGASARSAIALADKTIERGQVGDSGNMTKIAIIAAIVGGIVITARALA